LRPRAELGILCLAMKATLKQPTDRDQLQQLLRTEPNAKQRDRYRVVMLAASGQDGRELTREQIAQQVGRSRQFVDQWVKRYRDGGVENLRPAKQPGRRPMLNADEQEQLRQMLDAGPQPGRDPRSVFFGQDIRDLIRHRFNKLYSLSGTYALLDRLDYRWLCPRPHHPERDAAAQEAFKSSVVEQIDALRAARPDQRVVTYFQDEARFGQKGTMARVWARRGSRPTVPRQHQYDYLYVFAAASDETGDAVAMISPRVDTGIMNLFLHRFSQSLSPDVHAVMILDQAGWHVSKELVTPSNVTLIYLPPRSPELNPIENLWHWITSHYWSNRVHADYESMLGAADAAMATTIADRERIKSICHAPYLRRENHV
jgi:transposase